jgi:hypothetical protein
MDCMVYQFACEGCPRNVGFHQHPCSIPGFDDVRWENPRLDDDPHQRTVSNFTPGADRPANTPRSDAPALGLGVPAQVTVETIRFCRRSRGLGQPVISACDNAGPGERVPVGAPLWGRWNGLWPLGRTACMVCRLPGAFHRFLPGRPRLGYPQDHARPAWGRRFSGT